MLLVLGSRRRSILNGLLQLIFRSGTAADSLAGTNPVGQTGNRLLTTVGFYLYAIVAADDDTIIGYRRIARRQSRFIESRLVIDFDHFCFNSLSCHSAFIAIDMDIAEVQVILVEAELVDRTASCIRSRTIDGHIVVTIDRLYFRMLPGFRYGIRDIAVDLLQAIVDLLVDLVDSLHYGSRAASQILQVICQLANCTEFRCLGHIIDDDLAVDRALGIDYVNGDTVLALRICDILSILVLADTIGALPDMEFAVSGLFRNIRDGLGQLIFRRSAAADCRAIPGRISKPHNGLRCAVHRDTADRRCASRAVQGNLLGCITRIVQYDAACRHFSGTNGQRTCLTEVNVLVELDLDGTCRASIIGVSHRRDIALLDNRTVCAIGSIPLDSDCTSQCLGNFLLATIIGTFISRQTKAACARS